MWQRIQTVFLGIAVITLIGSLIMPLWQVQSGETLITLTPFYLLKDNSLNYYPYSLTAILSVAALTLAILTIRRFDNRIVQMKLAALNTLILLGVLICIIVFTTNLAEQFAVRGKNGISMYLVFAAVICNWLALRFIRRDERLVKDSDRLR